jgi:hypothetical protein
MRKYNIENLKPFNERTPEERKRIASMGGKASGAVKKYNKSIINIAKQLLQMRPDDKVSQMLKSNVPELKDEDLTLKVAMVFGQIRAATNGNTFAFQQIQKTIGEEPKGDISTEDKIDVLFSAITDEFKRKK